MARSTVNRPRLGLETLEARTLLDVGLTSIVSHIDYTPLSYLQTVQSSWTDAVVQPVEIDRGGFDYNAYFRPVPQLESLRGAPATLYLNFNGDSRTNWRNIEFGEVRTYSTPQTISPFDFDGTPHQFGDLELDWMREIWARVAEDFSPFNINVTTVDPGNLTNGQTLMVNIGDSNGWYGTNNSGISSIGNFTDAMPNIVYVFTEKMGSKSSPEFVNQVADTVSHEAGHGFGLEHHQVLNADFSVQAQYAPGNATWTPIMGNSLNGNRLTWGLGVYATRTDDTFSPNYQWDIGVLASRTNGFGFRPDEAGDRIDTARALSFDIMGRATINGVVGLHGKWYDDEQDQPSISTDADVYTFSTAGGDVSLRADLLDYINGANLRTRVELWSADRMIATADSGYAGAAVFNANLAGGQYYVKVVQGGGWNDIGQYTLTVAKPDLNVIGRIDRMPYVVRALNPDEARDYQTLAAEQEWELDPTEAAQDQATDPGLPNDAAWIDNPWNDPQPLLEEVQSQEEGQSLNAPHLDQIAPLADVQVQVVRVKGLRQVVISDALTGVKKYAGYPFGKAFRGNIQFEKRDVDGDGILDVIVRAKKGRKALAAVLSGNTGANLPLSLAN